MTEQLNEYKQKRNFEKTSEPGGKTKTGGKVLKFVVQHHLARKDHYDFRLEWGGVLLSWAVPKGPSYNVSDKRLAIKVEDHPLEYRNFEGTIPKGEYGGGVVMLWDEGYWKPYSNVEEGLREGSLKFCLEGKRLRGNWALVRLKAKEGDTKDNWIFFKEKDEYAKDEDGIAKYTTSIRTGRTMEEIEEGKGKKITKNPFDKVEVQLAKLVTKIPEGEEWIYEFKYDGYRIVAYIEDNKVRLMTRNNNDYTKKFPDVINPLLDLANGRSMIIDGEMVIVDESGKTNFQALQKYIKYHKEGNLTYFVFDILALDGEDLRGQRQIDRKTMLETLMNGTPPNLIYSKHIIGNGEQIFAVAKEAGMEGIVGKKADSVYAGARNNDWIKIKCNQRQEFVVGGYTLSDKKTSGISSLLLGVYEGKDLIFAGRAGSGLSEADAETLEKDFLKIKAKDSPFKHTPKNRANEEIVWLKPETVAEIKFAEWTQDNLLRQAIFKGMRTDKNPKDIKREKADEETESQAFAKDGKETMTTDVKSIIEEVKISNPDKVIFEDPVITKGDIISYYAKVADRMLPYVGHRVLSIVRCPKGISQTCFFKKHPGADSKGVVVMPVTNSDNETELYFYIDNALGLVSEAQMGTLEFHTWGSRTEDIEKPDFMVFDLDPDEGMSLNTVRQGVLDLKSILAELSLKAYLKTSGGKGYHIVVPFKPSISWEAFHEFARRVAQVMEQKWPDRYTSNVRKANRKNKIFIDWMRNGRGATSVAPYSIRARKGACVSMPIAWEELETVAPAGINMAESLRRIGKGIDPWKDFFQNKQQLK